MANIDAVIDWETIGPAPNGKVVELSAIAFSDSLDEDIVFDELVKKGIKIKFDLKAQKSRITTSETIEWWKKQSPEAQEILKPSDEDMTLEEGMKMFAEYIKNSGIDPWKSHMWCRGQSFDFPILIDVLRGVHGTVDTFSHEPVKFWNQRDIRTAIEALLLERDQTTTPLPKGTLDGFIMHNSIHDCAKDVIMLKYAKRYALGLEDFPSEIDPLSVKTSK